MASRKYTGKYPRRIKMVYGIDTGLVAVLSNDGTEVNVKASKTAGKMPQLGQDIDDFISPNDDRHIDYRHNPIKGGTVNRSGLTDKQYINRRSQITRRTPKKRLVKRRIEHVVSGKPPGYFPNPAKPSRLEFINARTKLLAKLCKLPGPDEYPKVGTLLLNKVFGGRYQITQVTGPGSGEADLSGTLTMTEMEEWLNGAITIADARFKSV